MARSSASDPWSRPGLVAADKRASAIATMFVGLTVATLLGVPFGAWFGLLFGWRTAFWAVAAIGVMAFVVLLVFVPNHVGRDEKAVPLREELAVLGRPQVQLGLAITVLGFAGLFTIFTYIQPILTRVTGFSDAAVSPVLLVFGAGLSIGNIAGGKFADRGLARALVGTLASLAIILVALAPALSVKIPTVLLIGLLGVAAFATVAPLQLRVLEKAGAAGQNLASSLNIAAFNLGNALGAWAGGLTIDHGHWSRRTAVGRSGDHRARIDPGALEPAPRPKARNGGRIRERARRTMEFRNLGRSGLKVPVLSFGTGTFGGQGPLFSAWGNSGVEEARRLIDICVEAGANLFDSADVYSNGAAEEVLGAAIKGSPQ